MESNNQYPTMWTTGFIGGVKVSFTFPIRNEMAAYEQASAIIGKLLADGFKTTEPGLESGEQKEPIGWVLRREKDDGTPVIDLYKASERFTFRYVMCYLDSEDDVKAFQDATGLKLSSLPLYVGDRLERDGKEKSKKYIVPVAHTANAVIKDNPDYNPEETDVKKKKPARIFVRWASETATPQPAAIGNPTATKPEASRVAEFDNEALTITSIQPRTDSAGWYGIGLFDDGTGKHEMRVNLFAPEDPKLITDAGYEWKTGACEIPVILRTQDSRIRIASVTPKNTQNAANGHPDANTGTNQEPAWYATPVKDSWGVLKGWLLQYVYGKNTFAMNNSLLKRGVAADAKALKPADAWAMKTAGEVVKFLQTRHEEKQTA